MSFLTENTPPKNVAAPQEATDPVFDATTASFVKEVMEASHARLVLAVFRSSRSATSDQLTALLEKAVRATKGAARLAKVNADENAALVGSLRIQSIPTVFAFFEGQVVDGFAGTLPEAKIQGWVQKLVQATASQPDDGGAGDIETALKEAETLRASGNIATAEAIYDDILTFTPEEIRGFVGKLRCMLASKDSITVENFFSALPVAIRENKALDFVRAALDLAAEGKGTTVAQLEAKISGAPDDLQLRYALAMALYAERRVEECMDVLLALVARDRKWQDEAARKQLVKLFDVLGPTDPLTISARKRLSSILFA